MAEKQLEAFNYLSHLHSKSPEVAESIGHLVRAWHIACVSTSFVHQSSQLHRPIPISVGCFWAVSEVKRVSDGPLVPGPVLLLFFQHETPDPPFSHVLDPWNYCGLCLFAYSLLCICSVCLVQTASIVSHWAFLPVALIAVSFA